MSDYDVERRLWNLEHGAAGGPSFLELFVFLAVLSWFGLSTMLYRTPSQRQAADGRQYLCWVTDVAWPWDRGQTHTLQSCLPVDHVVRTKRGSE